MEMSAITDPRQREDIARVMRDLSGYRALVSRYLVQQLELDAVLDAHCADPQRRYEPLPTVGKGFGFASELRPTSASLHPAAAPTK